MENEWCRAILRSFIQRLQGRRNRSGQSGFGRTISFAYIINYSLCMTQRYICTCASTWYIRSHDSLAMATSDSSSCKSFPAEPHQPRSFNFPKREFGKKKVLKRSFIPSWFDCYKWLDYDEAQDAAFCHVCRCAADQRRLKTSHKDSTFIYKDSGTGKMPHSVWQGMREAIVTKKLCRL